MLCAAWLAGIFAMANSWDALMYVPLLATLLGAHVLGACSAEIIQVAAVCMEAKMTVLQIAELQLAYPTFTQAIGQTALQLTRELDLLPGARRSMAMS